VRPISPHSVSNPVVLHIQPRANAPLASDCAEVDALVSAIMDADTATLHNHVNELGGWIASTATAQGAEAAQPGIDALVNFAAGDGSLGRLSQRLMCDLYGGQANIRNSVHNAAHAMGRHVLRTQEHQVPQGTAAADLQKGRHAHVSGLTLSATVAYMGGLASEPPGGNNGAGVSPDFTNHLARQLDLSAADGARLLDQQREAEDVELLAASAQLTGIRAAQALPSLSLLATSREVVAEVFATASPARADEPTMVWVNTDTSLQWDQHNPRAFRHWMPVFGTRDADGQVHWHILNTMQGAPSADAAAKALAAFLARSGQQVTIHAAAMQDDTANACGPLGHFFAKQLARQGDRSSDGISKGLDTLIREWGKLSAQDRQAWMLAIRTELIQAACDRWNQPQPALTRRLPPMPVQALPSLPGRLSPRT